MQIFRFDTLLLFSSIAAFGFAPVAANDFTFSRQLLEFVLTAGDLSDLAYATSFDQVDYDYLHVFHYEPDQAIIVRKNGYCYAAFRGSTYTVADWKKNLDTGTGNVCSNGECCTAREGFIDAYNAPYVNDLEDTLRVCAADCDTLDECVILTGHSQGAAIAEVAALLLHDLNPYVITFASLPTIIRPCSGVQSDRWYSFFNTRESKGASSSALLYDPVLSIPGPGDQFGHMFVFSHDGIAYIGLDPDVSFGNPDLTVAAHLLSVKNGYVDRLAALAGKQSYTVKGFADGGYCSEDVECQSNTCQRDATVSYKTCIGTTCNSNSECDTGRCDSGQCVEKVGSCGQCNEDSDCVYGRCLLSSRCSGPGQLMEDGCLCVWDSDCDSGRCEGYFPPTCKALLPSGSACSESSDCMSGRCTWFFHCS